MTSSPHRLRGILEMSLFITFTAGPPAAHTGRDALRHLPLTKGLQVPPLRAQTPTVWCVVVTSRHVTGSESFVYEGVR